MTGRFIQIPVDTYESLAGLAREEAWGRDLDGFIEAEMEGILSIHGWTRISSTSTGIVCPRP